MTQHVYRPETLTEALRLRRETAALPFAGGTDLMVKYKRWTGLPPGFPGDVLFLSHLPELKRLESRDETLLIGAGVTLAALARHSETPGLLREAVLSIAAPAVRNIATLAGNVCNASPAGDGICALYALDARLELTRLEGRREVPVMDFITGPGRTLLKDDELVTALLIPLRKTNLHTFRKVGTRKANALAKLSFAAVGKIEGDTVAWLALSFGAVGPTVVRVPELEEKLVGRPVVELEAMIPDLLAGYGTRITPIDDQRSTAEYRKQVALNLLKSFLENLSKGLKVKV